MTTTRTRKDTYLQAYDEGYASAERRIAGDHQHAEAQACSLAGWSEDYTRRAFCDGWKDAYDADYALNVGGGEDSIAADERRVGA